MVATAAEVDGEAVLQRQAAGQDGAAGGVPPGPQDPPVDHPGGETSDDRHLQDSGRHVGPPERPHVLLDVDPPQIAAARRPRPHEVPRPPQSTGDEGVVDAAVLAAVERMQPLQAESGDVIAGAVEDRGREWV